MTILLAGASGTIGSLVIQRLAGEGVAVRALTRLPSTARLPDGVRAVLGDLSDVDATRDAPVGISTVLLLVPNVPDELTQALLALDAIREAGIERVVYLSVFKVADYVDVPHFIDKDTVERAIAAVRLPATVLRPAYYMQNDARQSDALRGPGLYVMPVGAVGVSMVDTRDIADVAASELLRRERASGPLSSEAIDLVGPEPLTGAALAALWGEVLARPVRYGGDDLAAMEGALRGRGAPGWLATDMRLMTQRYQRDGAVASADAVASLTRRLGRPPRSYRAFAEEMAPSGMPVEPVRAGGSSRVLSSTATSARPAARQW